MIPEVYYRLQEQLDRWSVGYPKTTSGVEMKILEKMFSEEQAALFLNMNLILEPVETIAERIDEDTKTIASLLEQMVEKGLVFRHSKGNKRRYSAVPFVLGIYEYQVGKMDKEFAQYFEAYLQEAFYKSIAGVTSLLRPIPINRSVNTNSNVAPFDDALEILRKQKKIVIADCICRFNKN